MSGGDCWGHQRAQQRTHPKLGGAGEGGKHADKRIYVEKQGIPCPETGYRRPCREQKVDCRVKIVERWEWEGKRKVLYPRLSEPGELSQNPLYRHDSESQFRVTARHTSLLPCPLQRNPSV